ncbi:hypothetical protein BU14_0625s0005 [Porphyra umbilicalis]|uniref:Uncharacterized protein n=1 Tax=Porphyra umbilicalis TaxID=2786 RepID=A0A1X6NQR4_PORUM|nr:hypothetical protein BU14_0625s0005 [Porphyra umbilicalis]|eukprot:OSX70954.1 hypothetical protein BU14_0625s0005 [Porphyra umbilicalis]
MRSGALTSPSGPARHGVTARPAQARGRRPVDHPAREGSPTAPAVGSDRRHATVARPAGRRPAVAPPRVATAADTGCERRVGGPALPPPPPPPPPPPGRAKPHAPATRARTARRRGARPTRGRRVGNARTVGGGATRRARCRERGRGRGGGGGRGGAAAWQRGGEFRGRGIVGGGRRPRRTRRAADGRCWCRRRRALWRGRRATAARPARRGGTRARRADRGGRARSADGADGWVEFGMADRGGRRRRGAPRRTAPWR